MASIDFPVHQADGVAFGTSHSDDGWRSAGIDQVIPGFVHMLNTHEARLESGGTWREETSGLKESFDRFERILKARGWWKLV